MSEHKSKTVTVRVDGEDLAEFIVDHLAVQITQFEVVVRGTCRNTYEDPVLLSSEFLERLGYGAGGELLPEPKKPSRWDHLLAAITGVMP